MLLAAQGDSVDLLEETGLGAHAAPENHEELLCAFDELVARGFSAEERAIAAQGMLAAHSRQKVACEFAETLLGIFGQGR